MYSFVNTQHRYLGHLVDPHTVPFKLNVPSTAMNSRARSNKKVILNKCILAIIYSKYQFYEKSVNSKTKWCLYRESKTRPGEKKKLALLLTAATLTHLDLVFRLFKRIELRILLIEKDLKNCRFSNNSNKFCRKTSMDFKLRKKTPLQMIFQNKRNFSTRRSFRPKTTDTPNISKNGSQPNNRI